MGSTALPKKKFDPRKKSERFSFSLKTFVRIMPFSEIRLRACRRPSIFSLAESAPPSNFRDALFSLLQGADPLDPKAPQFHKLRIQGRMQNFEKKSQNALNQVLILQKYRSLRAEHLYHVYWKRCFLRRIMVERRFVENFGPDVIYFVVGH